MGALAHLGGAWPKQALEGEQERLLKKKWIIALSFPLNPEHQLPISVLGCSHI